MNRIVSIMVLVAFAVFGGTANAVPNFVDDNTSTPASKTDIRPVTNPTQQWGAADANAVFGALNDIRTVLKRDSAVVFNVKAFGAKGDGLTPDGAAIRAAVAAASVSTNGVFGGTVYFPKGKYIYDGAKLVVTNGVRLLGEGSFAGTILQAANGFNDVALIQNNNQNGIDEAVAIQGMLIDGNASGGAICSVAVVDLGGMFVPTFVRDVVIRGGSSVGLHLSANGTPGGMGPILIENVWTVNNIGHNVFVDETGSNTGAAMGIVFVNLISEHQGSNKSAVYLHGIGQSDGPMFFGLHIEQGSGALGRTCITFDGVSHARVIGLTVLGDPSTVSEVVKITNVTPNVGIEVGPIVNPNLLTPVIRDLHNGVTVQNPVYNINGKYVTADHNTIGGQRFTATSGSVSVAMQDSNNVDRAWFDSSGRLTGNSVNGAGIDIAGDATNNRPLTFQPSVASGLSNTYGYYYPFGGGGVLRERSLTGGQDVRQIGTDGSQFFYQPLTVQSSTTFQSSVIASGGSVPVLSSCGTSPTVTAGSTNFAGSFTTGSATTACTITFGSAFANAPSCTVVSPGQVVPTYNESTTAISMTVGVASTKYRYTCVGH